MIDRYIREVPKYLKRKQKNKKYTNIHHKHDLLLTYVDIERGIIYYEKYRCKICGKEELKIGSIKNPIVLTDELIKEMEQNNEYFRKKDKERRKK